MDKAAGISTVSTGSVGKFWHGAFGIQETDQGKKSQKELDQGLAWKRFVKICFRCGRSVSSWCFILYIPALKFESYNCYESIHQVKTLNFEAVFRWTSATLWVRGAPLPSQAIHRMLHWSKILEMPPSYIAKSVECYSAETKADVTEMWHWNSTISNMAFRVAPFSLGRLLTRYELGSSSLQICFCTCELTDSYMNILKGFAWWRFIRIFF